jgi:predicted dehydrogenase
MAPEDVHPYYRGAIDILRCDAIHAVDALRYYAGLPEVASVESVVRTLDCWYAVGFNAIVRFENDVVGVLHANWRTGRRFFKFEFHAYGASAYADADGDGRAWKDNGQDPCLATTCSDFAGSTETYVHQGFQAENRAFIDAVRGGRPPHNSIADAVKTMQLVDEIYARSGRA